jgi:GAF domain-containing protein
MSEMTDITQNRPSPLPDIQTWQQQLVQGLLRALVVVGALATVGAIYDAYATQVLWQIPVFLGAYSLLVVITLSRRAPYVLQAGILLALVYGLGIFDLFIAGQTGDAFPFLLTVPLLAALFFRQRGGVLALVIATVTLVVFGWLFVAGFIVIPPQELASPRDLGSWISRILVYLMLALLLMLPVNFLIQRLVATLTQSHKLTRELEEHQASLEAEVKERTADLGQRTRYLEATAEVARDASSVLELQELLSRVVSLVSERFGFYHTGIFLLDPTGEWAVLRAASSEGGQRMLARGQRLKVSQASIVGYATSTGKPRIAFDIGADAVHFDNADLLETRSEMALPLRARGEIIGALDVQSKETAAFSDEDVVVLQTLADQVAVAIINALLFQQVEESLEAERRAYGNVSRQAWQELLHAHSQLGFLSNRHGVSFLSDQRRPEIEKALCTGQITSDDNGAANLAMPVKIRGQVIGAVGGRKPPDAGKWTEDEVALLETLTEQLSVAMESARLYQDTQLRAERERLTGQVTARIRETLDMETVLKIAVREISEAMGLAALDVRIGMEELPGDRSNANPENGEEH